MRAHGGYPIASWSLGAGLAVALALGMGVARAEEGRIVFVSVDEVKGVLDKGAPVLLVDVRSREEYSIRHIQGAISVPLSAMQARYREIPRQGLVVLY